MYIPKIRSRHGSHDVIRGNLEALPFRSVVRFGSLTPTKDVYPFSVAKKIPIIEINTVEAVKNSASKYLMKRCFSNAGVKTADWWDIYYGVYDFKGILLSSHLGNEEPSNEPFNLPYPIVAKHHFGSRGTGNYLLKSAADLQQWMNGKTLNKYIFEQYLKGMDREYRLHVNKNGCFYTCRKMLKQDTPDSCRWYRNDSNSTWIMESNEMFDKPVNWLEIEAECIKALNAVGLDIAAFDVKVQTSKDKKGVVREKPEFSIIECNSAPSFGKVTSEKYKEVLPKLLQKKWESISKLQE